MGFPINNYYAALGPLGGLPPCDPVLGPLGPELLAGRSAPINESPGLGVLAGRPLCGSNSLPALSAAFLPRNLDSPKYLCSRVASTSYPPTVLPKFLGVQLASRLGRSLLGGAPAPSLEAYVLGARSDIGGLLAVPSALGAYVLAGRSSAVLGAVVPSALGAYVLAGRSSFVLGAWYL